MIPQSAGETLRNMLKLGKVEATLKPKAGTVQQLRPVHLQQDALAAKLVVQQARESIPEQCQEIYHRDEERLMAVPANDVLEAAIRRINAASRGEDEASPKKPLAIFTQVQQHSQTAGELERG
jgi:hypothetical protein